MLFVSFMCITQHKVPFILKCQQKPFQKPLSQPRYFNTMSDWKAAAPADWSVMQLWVILVAAGQQQLTSHLIRLSSRHV